MNSASASSPDAGHTRRWQSIAGKSFRCGWLILFGLATESVAGADNNLNWNDNSINETGFQIERSLDGSNFVSIATVGENVTTYSDNGVDPDTTYWYRVAAYNEFGSSGYTNVASFTTDPAPNAAPTIDAISDQVVDAVSGFSQPLEVGISDAETASSQLLVTATSSNESLIPVANINFTSIPVGRSVSIVPASDQSGSSIITIYVSDGDNIVSESFHVEVEPVATFALSDPGDGESYYLGETIAFTPTLVGGVSPQSVSYYIDGVLVNEVTQSPFSNAIQLPVVGTVQLHVVAKLPGGGEIVSDAVEIDVLEIPAPTGLVVTGVSGG